MTPASSASAARRTSRAATIVHPKFGPRAGPFPPLDPERLAFLATRLGEAVDADPRWRTIARGLLKLGGHAIVVPRTPDEVVPPRALLARTTIWREADVARDVVSARKLPLFLAQRWAARPDGVQLVRGWALDDEGLWRPHLWTCERRRAMEFAGARRGYVGVVLTPDEAHDFATPLLAAHAQVRETQEQLRVAREAARARDAQAGAGRDGGGADLRAPRR